MDFFPPSLFLSYFFCSVGQNTCRYLQYPYRSIYTSIQQLQYIIGARNDKVTQSKCCLQNSHLLFHLLVSFLDACKASVADPSTQNEGPALVLCMAQACIVWLSLCDAPCASCTASYVHRTQRCALFQKAGVTGRGNEREILKNFEIFLKKAKEVLLQSLYEQNRLVG